MTIALPDPGASHRSDSAAAEGGMGPRPADFRSGGVRPIAHWVREAARDPNHWYWGIWRDNLHELQHELWILTGKPSDYSWGSIRERVQATTDCVRLVLALEQPDYFEGRDPSAARALEVECRVRGHARVCAQSLDQRLDVIREVLASLPEVPSGE